MSLLSGVCTGGGRPGRGWGIHPVCPGERHGPYARTRNPRLPMREPPRGWGEGKPSVRSVNQPCSHFARRPAANRTMSTRDRIPSLR
ncbi:hypothetical protein LK07_28365 [Streptomyces pluripotens]|uniref:Uncharacterized protein n=1 Tax=Streptomyces pluripotens TaxID=1355015 RepID=A0A221P4W6_9ACTN|nr:hypothetical protein LK06_027195 [Streptomyces pluripotens]ASN27301.1 hypothetical protein LK07_28365 [Streptomyces pluripotens]